MPAGAPLVGDLELVTAHVSRRQGDKETRRHEQMSPCLLVLLSPCLLLPTLQLLLESAQPAGRIMALRPDAIGRCFDGKRQTNLGHPVLGEENRLPQNRVRELT